MVVDVGVVRNHIKPKADSTLYNMRKVDLIEYIRTLEHNYNVAVSFNENQAKYIESLGFTGGTVQKWIPVTERLPESQADVLVVAFWHEKWQTMIGWHSDCGNKWRVITPHGEYEPGGVTHWMPLPEAPKGE